jgi:cell division ATPase FtsA
MLAPLMEALNKETHPLKVLYVTGGGAMLQGVVEYIQSKTPLPTMFGSHAGWLSEDTPDEYCQPQYASLVGTLLLAAEYRKAHPMVKTYKKNKPIIEEAKNMILDLFSRTDY